MPLTLYDENGNYVWDTDSVGGGVFATVKTFQPEDSGTFTYPAFAGRTAYVVPMLTWNSVSDMGVVLDQTLGYPRLTISPTPSLKRKIALLIQ